MAKSKIISDAALVARAALAGDRDAFGTLVKRYQSPLRRFLLYLCADAEWSKDLAQETFIKAWLAIGSFRAVAGFRTWLFRIGYNVFYDAVRARKPHLDVADYADCLVAALPDHDRALDVAKAIAALADRERTAVLLFYVEDCTFAKIATIMNCPAGTVKSLVFRARQKVAAVLTDNFNNENYDR